jgi:signal transduction histidine kinase
LESELKAQNAHFFGELRRHGGARFDWKKINTEIHEWMPDANPPLYMEVVTGDGHVRWHSSNLPSPGFKGLKSGFSDFDLGGQPLRVLVGKEDGVIFGLGTDLREARQFTRDVILALLAGLPVALAFAWIGGHWVASRAIDPVVQIAAAAESITAERLHQRVPVPPVADEIQRLAIVLNAAFDRLERSYQQALRFSADASHELKTPLTILRVSIEAVLDSPTLSDTDHEAISGLLEQTRRLSNITASLLLLARADAGRLTLDTAEHDLAALTEACAEDARIMAESRGVRVDCTLPERAPAHVDALRFSQIASNLFDNAVKYNRTGGEIRVSLAEDSAAWRLVVANTGPGIAPEHQVHLFERFFRAERSSDESGCGLGLGLARELAIAHGGDVQLVRSDASWTEFAVLLPKDGPNGTN